ncbi:hypothetical protein JOD55_000207 [Arcanobacterium pluranimalium]|uniref:hypothetical protein n=1 Tax=Arcanobacterium pluranimalium TaxID=108028 RepID=UPI00195A4A94|nr:hypothetical protein [Arcanobacterium pluranimalium]MBM7824380.1 hypothetical protein [Arcanobacterium pluranimalium]
MKALDVLDPEFYGGGFDYPRFRANRNYLVLARYTNIQYRWFRDPLVDEQFYILHEDCDFDPYLSRRGSYPMFFPVRLFEVTDGDCLTWETREYKDRKGRVERVISADSKFFELLDMPAFFDNITDGAPEYFAALYEKFPPETWFEGGEVGYEKFALLFDEYKKLVDESWSYNGDPTERLDTLSRLRREIGQLEGSVEFPASYDPEQLSQYDADVESLKNWLISR